jgi:hypothetical protein
VIDKNGDSNQVKGYRRPANLTSYVPDQEMQAFDTDRLYALVGKEKTFVLVQYFQFDKVIKPAVWFLRIDLLSLFPAHAATEMFGVYPTIHVSR